MIVSRIALVVGGIGAGGDLKIKFGDGVVKTIAVDT